MDLSLNYGKSEPTNFPTTPIQFAREKPGLFNPTGNTSASSATKLTASPTAGAFGQKNNSFIKFRKVRDRRSTVRLFSEKIKIIKKNKEFLK